MAYPAAIALDDVQRLLYGANLGLTLPARDPWSFSTADEIQRHDIPDLQPWFATAGSVTVLERLAVYASSGAGFAADGPGVAPEPAYDLCLRRLPSPASADDPPSDGELPGEDGPMLLRVCKSLPHQGKSFFCPLPHYHPNRCESAFILLADTPAGRRLDAQAAAHVVRPCKIDILRRFLCNMPQPDSAFETASALSESVINSTVCFWQKLWLFVVPHYDHFVHKCWLVRE